MKLNKVLGYLCLSILLVGFLVYCYMLYDMRIAHNMCAVVVNFPRISLQGTEYGNICVIQRANGSTSYTKYIHKEEYMNYTAIDITGRAVAVEGAFNYMYNESLVSS